jgi:hypothetical protein
MVICSFSVLFRCIHDIPLLKPRRVSSHSRFKEKRHHPAAFLESVVQSTYHIIFSPYYSMLLLVRADQNETEVLKFTGGNPEGAENARWFADEHPQTMRAM